MPIIALDATTHPTGITSGPHVFQSTTKALSITTPAFSTGGAVRTLYLLYSGPASASGAASIVSVSTSGGLFTTPFAKVVAQNGGATANGCSEIWYAVTLATLSSITVTVSLNPAVVGNFGTLSIVALVGASVLAPTNTVAVEVDTSGTIAATITGTAAGSWVLGTAQDSNTGAARTYLASTTEIIGGADSGGDYDTNFFYNGPASPGGSLTLGTSSPANAIYTIALVEIPVLSGGSSFTGTQTETNSPVVALALGGIAGAGSESESTAPSASFGSAVAAVASQAESTSALDQFAGALAMSAAQAESTQSLDAWAAGLTLGCVQAETATPSVTFAVAQSMGASFLAATSPSVSFDDGATPVRGPKALPFWPWWYRTRLPLNRRRIM